jgi:uncharacterized protein YggE
VADDKQSPVLEPFITAAGEATLPFPADVAWLHLVLVEQAKTASEAAERSAGRVNVVLDRIRETEPRLPESVIEVERKLEPIFDDDGDFAAFRYHRVVRAQMPVEPAGTLFDVAIMSGAGMGSRIVFGARDPVVVRARAIEAALAVARSNAQAAAIAAGGALGEAVSVEVEADLAPDYPDPLLLVTARAAVAYARAR